MGRRVAIVQSSYIPWKGYFDLVRAVDEFILLDDVQFTKRDWRSRNRIKSARGLLWLSIPVQTSGRYLQVIQDTVIADDTWGTRHWRLIEASYADAPFFDAYAPIFEPLYRRPASNRLSDVNHSFIVAACSALGIGTPIRWSSDYQTRPGRNQRLIDLCREAGATEYLSGPSARAYLDEAAFADAGVAVRFADYTGYPEYPQLHPPFEHAVSALDLLFSAGPRSLEYLKPLCTALPQPS